MLLTNCFAPMFLCTLGNDLTLEGLPDHRQSACHAVASVIQSFVIQPNPPASADDSPQRLLLMVKPLAEMVEYWSQRVCAATAGSNAAKNEKAFIVFVK